MFFAGTWIENQFGKMLDLNHILPAGQDVVILCRLPRPAGGLIPVRLLLRHQIYESTLAEIRLQYPDTHSFVVIPARSDDYVEVGEP